MTKEQGLTTLEEPLMTPAEMGRYLSGLRKTHAGGAPRSNKPRCPCGAMTLKRAKARAHRCQKAAR